jgi:hypothetical protein
MRLWNLFLDGLPMASISTTMPMLATLIFGWRSGEGIIRALREVVVKSGIVLFNAGRATILITKTQMGAAGIKSHIEVAAEEKGKAMYSN